MKQPEVLEKLQSIFDSVFMEPVTVTPELTADQVDEWDSIVHVSLVLAVEQTFGIRFRVGEVEATRSVGDFANLIASKTASKT